MIQLCPRCGSDKILIRPNENNSIFCDDCDWCDLKWAAWIQTDGVLNARLKKNVKEMMNKNDFRTRYKRSTRNSWIRMFWL